MVDNSIQAAHRAGIYRAGQPVTFQREAGVAPNIVTTSAQVTAIVRGYTPNTTAPAQEGLASSSVGGITQEDRQIIVMADDLANGGFPIPVQKHDKVVISATGEVLDVTRVDAEKRYIAGAIEAFGAGVQ